MTLANMQAQRVRSLGVVCDNCPCAPVRRPDLDRPIGCGIDPALQRPAAREDKRVHAT